MALPLALPEQYAPHIRLLRSCGSTLTHAAELLTRGELAEWETILAGSQTAGRGQLGRSWQSPEGNLYVAMRLPRIAPFDGSAAAPALGGLLAAALRSLDLPILVKWPNDLVLSCPPSDTARLRKIGGILVEERHGAIVAGVGLNIAVAPPDSVLRREAALPAGCLSEAHLRGLGINSLAELWQRLSAFIRAETKKNIAQNWRTMLEPLLAFRGENILMRDETLYNGRLIGVDKDGGLRLITAEGEITLFSGSLQVPGEHLE